jgi:nuclear cap-binding protein subunit 1
LADKAVFAPLLLDDDDYDRRPQRRRHDYAPVPVRIRKQLLNLAESPLRRWHEEVQAIAQLVADNYDDAQLRAGFLDLVLQLVVEQPLKTPFVAAVIVMCNALRPELVEEVLVRAAPLTQAKVREGEWRDVKLYLKFLACLQSCLAGDGVFPILEELFNRAVVLQTEDSVDVSAHSA